MGWGYGSRARGEPRLSTLAVPPEGYMTSRTVREASGLQSLTSVLYLRLHKEDRSSSFHCAAEYRLPKGQIDRLNSAPFSLTLHCESTQGTPIPPNPWGGLSASLCAPRQTYTESH